MIITIVQSSFFFFFLFKANRKKQNLWKLNICSFNLMLTNAFFYKILNGIKFTISLKLLTINNIFVMTFVSVPNWFEQIFFYFWFLNTNYHWFLYCTVIWVKYIFAIEIIFRVLSLVFTVSLSLIILRKHAH